MVKFPEAHVRLFQGMFVCRRCKTRMRAPIRKVLDHKISCRKCKSKVLRPVRKK